MACKVVNVTGLSHLHSALLSLHSSEIGIDNLECGKFINNSLNNCAKMIANTSPVLYSITV